jgi:16S rRNA G966 N2-methylase RsmD
MEQCSSSATALYKASLMKGSTFADLTGGFGIDCSYISRNFSKGHYIERNENLCSVAAHNFALLGLGHIEIINGNSEEVLPTLPSCDWIFLDPARRDGAGKKVVALADCEPDVAALRQQLLQKARRVMVKCSPMLDITAACRQLGCVSEVHTVAVNNECKELLLKIVQDGARGDVKIVCANLKKAGEMELFAQSRSDEETAACLYADRPDVFLYEPNVAILKGGLYKSVSEKFGVKKLHQNSHLYTSEELVEEFPGRKFRVLSVFSMNKKELKRELADVSKANVSVRNFPLSVEELRKKLKLKEGGDIYIFATTLRNGDKVLVKCVKC